MKTVRQVADTLGVSRQAIYRSLSALPSEMLSASDKGGQLINADGEAFLRAKLSGKLSAGQSADSPADNISDTLISMLQEELKAKNEHLAAKDAQLAEKDKQINELIASNKILSESINAAHKNELAETIIDGNLLIAKEKKNIFARIFRRN